MMYERGGNSGNSGRSTSSSYGYREPMMYAHDDDLMIHNDSMDMNRR